MRNLPPLIVVPVQINNCTRALHIFQQITSEKNLTPEMRRYGSDVDLVDQRKQDPHHPRACNEHDDDDDRADTAIEQAVGSASGSARATPSPLGGAGGVRVAMTPAQRGSGGRVARKPPLSSRSERKPPRYIYLQHVVFANLCGVDVLGATNSRLYCISAIFVSSRSEFNEFEGWFQTKCPCRMCSRALPPRPVGARGRASFCRRNYRFELWVSYHLLAFFLCRIVLLFLMYFVA